LALIFLFEVVFLPFFSLPTLLIFSYFCILKKFSAMMAIVEIKGQQFKVRENQSLYVHRVEAAEGEQIDFDSVLLMDNGSNVQIGKPYVSGARVRAQVVSHVQGDKVLVFKKKRRKSYQKMNGHRQQFTKLSIQSIG